MFTADFTENLLIASTDSNPDKYTNVMAVLCPKSPSRTICTTASSMPLLICFSAGFSSLPLRNLSSVRSCSRGSNSVFLQRNGDSQLTRTSRAFSPASLCFQLSFDHNLQLFFFPLKLHSLINICVSCKMCPARSSTYPAWCVDRCCSQQPVTLILLLDAE